MPVETAPSFTVTVADTLLPAVTVLVDLGNGFSLGLRPYFCHSSCERAFGLTKIRADPAIRALGARRRSQRSPRTLYAGKVSRGARACV